MSSMDTTGVDLYDQMYGVGSGFCNGCGPITLSAWPQADEIRLEYVEDDAL